MIVPQQRVDKLKKHPLWKGVHAKEEPKRKRVRGLIKELNECEVCGNKATDRHHVNGDLDDMVNILCVCRACHMKLDGRSERLIRYNDKLRPCQVFIIRLLSDGGLNQREISEKFGVTSANISSILLRKSWANI
jgi:hypothetical protein